MFEGKKVLVTGGTGLVGRELVELMVKRGADVTSVSLDENNLDPEWGATYLKRDLRSRDNCYEVCEGMDYVFHIAGIKGSPVVMKTFEYQIFRDFIMLNTNMIDAMYNTPTMKWGLYTSTIGTYGPARTFREEDLWTQNPSPNDWFAGWSKRMGEVQVDAHGEQYGERKMSILTRKVHEATESVEIWGNGTAGRDIIHARDVAGAAIFAVENQISEPLNVGHGRTFTIKEVIQTLVDVSGKDLEITHDLTKPTGDQFRVPNTERLNGHGFTPSVGLREGLEETYNWYNENGPTVGRYNPYYVGENND